MKIIRLH